jgi:hypothetical protein
MVGDARRWPAKYPYPPLRRERCAGFLIHEDLEELEE